MVVIVKVILPKYIYRVHENCIELKVEILTVYIR